MLGNLDNITCVSKLVQFVHCIKHTQKVQNLVFVIGHHILFISTSSMFAYTMHFHKAVAPRSCLINLACDDQMWYFTDVIIFIDPVSLDSLLSIFFTFSAIYGHAATVYEKVYLLMTDCYNYVSCLLCIIFLVERWEKCHSSIVFHCYFCIIWHSLILKAVVFSTCFTITTNL